MDLSTLAAMPVPSPMRPSMICSRGVGGGVSTRHEAPGDGGAGPPTGLA